MRLLQTASEVDNCDITVSCITVSDNQNVQCTATENSQIEVRSLQPSTNNVINKRSCSKPATYSTMSNNVNIYANTCVQNNA